jgi:protein-S-isoprenylcysteine O-methyltransferase Ste14
LAGSRLVSAASRRLAYGELRDQRRRKAFRKQQNYSLWVFAVILAIVLVPPFCDRRDLWVIDGGTVRYLGLALFFGGSILRLAAVFELGHRFSGLVAIQPDHQLKTDGLYRYIRHPGYTGLLVSMIGYVLVFRSSIGLILNVLLFLLLLSRMADEEKFLEAHFGSAYRTYCQKTRRLVPLIY